MKVQAGVLAALVAVSGLLIADALPVAAADVPSEAQVLSFMNAERSSHGLAPLAVDSALFSVAQGWAEHMAASGALAQNPTLESQAPAGWSALGENVGSAGTVDSVDQTFWASPEHRANILGNFDDVGVGVAWTHDGRLFVAVDFLTWAPGSSRPATAAGCSDHNAAAAPSSATATGYWILGAGGAVAARGTAPSLGSVATMGTTTEARAVAATPDRQGYWLLGTGGWVFTFGDAHFAGTVPASQGEAVDLAPARAGGYWILSRDGGVYSFGGARFFGSVPGLGIRTEAAKLVPTPSGNGYWILGTDGGVFSFGDARFLGSLPGIHVRDTSVAMSATPSGNGYWVLGSDGGVFSFGDATYHGSVPGLGCASSVASSLVATGDGGGYYVLGLDGRVFDFGDAPALGEWPGAPSVDLKLAAR